MTSSSVGLPEALDACSARGEESPDFCCEQASDIIVCVFFYKIEELFNVEMKAIDNDVESGDKLTARNMTLFYIPIH